MLITGITLLTGIIVACYLPQIVDSYWVSLLPICLFVSYINSQLRIIGLLLSGFLWATAVSHWQLDHRLSAEQNNKRLEVVGEVINIPQTSLISTRFLLKPHSIKGYVGKLPKKIRLNWRDAPVQLAPGQIWQLKIKIKQPHGYQNPGGFDYERWMFAKGIQATGYVVKSEFNKILDSTDLSLNVYRDRIKQHIEDYCLNCKNTGLIQALAIGYRGNIPHQTRSLLSQTGTAHLIAVSGLHIGIIASVFYALGLLLWSNLFFNSRLKRKELALLLAWFGGLSYSLLSGFDLPAQRAMLMLTIVFLSLSLRTAFNLLHSIVSALVLVLIVSPLAVLSESFWLTFSALLIIAFGAFLLQREPSRLKQMVIIQLLFSILFIPLSILIFGQIHSASMAANLLAVPLVSFIIVPLNFLLLMLFWIPQDLLQVLYGLLDRLLDGLTGYLNWLQDNGLQAINIAEMSELRLFLILLWVIILLLPRGLISKFFLLLIPLPVLFSQPAEISGNDLKMTVLDVGMGTSIVIQTAHHSLLYDLGPGNKQGYSLGEWVVYPYLLHQGISQPDRIVISNADQDHSGGLYALQEKLKGVPVFTGTVTNLKNKFSELQPVYDCHVTPDWMWDGIKFEFISDQPDVSLSSNNRSCVLKVTSKLTSILIAGDIERKQEQNLVKKVGDKLTADILVAPHHGSLTSSTEIFIQTVAAKQVIFSTGYLNRWKFPRPEIVQRYLKTGSQLMQTDRVGAIQVKCQSDECKIEPYRLQHPHIWY